MRRVGICEERGSGIDKVVEETEAHQLPPPLWEQQDAAFRVTLFAPKPFREMDRLERVHATYLHACLRYEQRETATNASLRERFGVDPRNSATVSRIIKDALEEESSSHSRRGRPRRLLATCRGGHEFV
ncbi:ATP-binding protein [Novosphingobium panipatense]